MSCEQCEQINRVGGHVRELGREIARLQAEAAPLLREYRRLQRSHLRCACCGVLVGPEHVEKQLTPEPVWQPRAGVNRGQRRYDVCSSCFAHLYKVHRSVPQQRAYEAALDAELGDSESDDEPA